MIKLIFSTWMWVVVENGRNFISIHTIEYDAIKPNYISIPKSINRSPALTIFYFSLLPLRRGRWSIICSRCDYRKCLWLCYHAEHNIATFYVVISTALCVRQLSKKKYEPQPKLFFIFFSLFVLFGKEITCLGTVKHYRTQSWSL